MTQISIEEIRELLREVTRDQAAMILGCTPQNIDMLRRKGRITSKGERVKLPTIRKGRYLLEDVLKFKREKGFYI